MLRIEGTMPITYLFQRWRFLWEGDRSDLAGLNFLAFILSGLSLVGFRGPRVPFRTCISTSLIGIASVSRVVVDGCLYNPLLILAFSSKLHGWWWMYYWTDACMQKKTWGLLRGGSRGIGVMVHTYSIRLQHLGVMVPANGKWDIPCVSDILGGVHVEVKDMWW